MFRLLCTQSIPWPSQGTKLSLSPGRELEDTVSHWLERRALKMSASHHTVHDVRHLETFSAGPLAHFRVPVANLQDSQILGPRSHVSKRTLTLEGRVDWTETPYVVAVNDLVDRFRPILVEVVKTSNNVTQNMVVETDDYPDRITWATHPCLQYGNKECVERVVSSVMHCLDNTTTRHVCNGKPCAKVGFMGTIFSGSKFLANLMSEPSIGVAIGHHSTTNDGGSSPFIALRAQSAPFERLMLQVRHPLMFLRSVQAEHYNKHRYISHDWLRAPSESWNSTPKEDLVVLLPEWAQVSSVSTNCSVANSEILELWVRVLDWPCNNYIQRRLPRLGAA